MNWMINSLDRLVEFLAEKKTVYAPSGVEQIRYKKITKGISVNLSRLSDFSAREIWQPATHYYLKYQEGPEADLKVTPYGEKGLVVLGLRPCEIKGVTVFDNLFKNTISYQEFRKSMIIIGYLCGTPLENCFCESMGISPVSSEKMDLALYDTEEGYILQAVTESGRDLLENSPFDQLSVPPEPSYRGSQKNQIQIADVVQRVKALSDTEWEELIFPCLNCRICSYVCPTCHCFSITDEVFKGEGGRAIVWDSCQSKYFNKEASGVNPRVKKLDRIKNRIFHKLIYYPLQNGELMCSGCGRCITHCPSGINFFKEIGEREKR